MRTGILIMRDAKGATSLLAGPENRYSELREQFAGYRESGLPKGAAALELWSSDGGRKRLSAEKLEAQNAAVAKKTAPKKAGGGKDE